MKKKVIRIILALCFLASGLLKIVSIRSFGQEVELYGEAYIGSWVSDYSLLIAIGVCVAEIVIAILALFGRFTRYTSLAFLVLLLFFVYLTGMNLFFPSPVGSIESCGCFGELIHFTPLSAFIKSFALCVIASINVMWNIEKLLKE